MHPADIKAALQKCGTTQTAVARSLRGPVSQMAVSHVISGRGKSARIALRISQLTGIPVSQLGPGKYPALEMLQSPASRRRAAA